MTCIKKFHLSPVANVFLSPVLVNAQAPVAQKIVNEVVFRRFQGEGVDFFKIGPH